VKLPLTVESTRGMTATFWWVMDDDENQIARCESESDARALCRAANAAAGLAGALERCDVSMDTAAVHGLPQQLPAAYRDSWAAAHTAARKALAAYRKESE
jgi:hypothetical protein